MKRCQRFLCALALIALTVLSCAQKSYNNEAKATAAAGPEFRWKHEAGG